MAMTEISLRQPLRYTIDLSAGLVQQPMRSQLMKGDKKANLVIVHLTDGGKDVTLSGVTVTGSFIRPPDAAEIPLTGETSGSEAIVTLDDACYSTEGYCEISVKLTVGETSRTILTLTGYVLSKGSGAYVDVSGVIPNIDDVIAQYAEMKRVTQETQAAGAAAGNAAGAANTAADEANRQAQAAQRAAAAADTAASKIDGLTVSAEKANEAGAEVSQKDGAYHVKFQLPKGDTGATPDITFEVATGAAGSDVQLEQSGTAEAPHIKLTIPRGDTGAVEGVDYYEGNPEALGTASPGTANGVARGNHVHPKPTPEELGAATIDDITPGAKTTYSSEKIEGELSSLSEQIENVGTPNLLVNSNFQKPYLINLLGLPSYGGTKRTPAISGWICDNAETQCDVHDDHISLINNTASGRVSFVQKLIDTHIGETFTVAWCDHDTGTVICGHATVPNIISGTNQYIGSADFNGHTARMMLSGHGELYYQFMVGSGNSVNVRWAALVLGTYTAENFPTPIWLHPRLEMIRMGLPTQPVNLLDNSDFTNPVNQRGGKSGTVGTYKYFIDRWTTGGTELMYELTSAGLRINAEIRQNNPFDKFAGKTLTLAAKVNGKIYAVSGNMPATVNAWTVHMRLDISNEFGMYVATGTDGLTQVRLYPLETASDVTFEWAALYEGAYTAETLPPYRPKGYDAELAACQKRFVHFPKNGNFSLYGYAQSETQLRTTIHTPVHMATDTNGSIMFNAIEDLRIMPGSAIKPTAVSNIGVSNNAVTCELTTSGLTAGDIYLVKMNSAFSISKDL